VGVGVGCLGTATAYFRRTWLGAGRGSLELEIRKVQVKNLNFGMLATGPAAHCLCPAVGCFCCSGDQSLDVCSEAGWQLALLIRKEAIHSETKMQVQCCGQRVMWMCSIAAIAHAYKENLAQHFTDLGVVRDWGLDFWGASARHVPGVVLAAYRRLRGG
jgi:hypothetical protein